MRSVIPAERNSFVLIALIAAVLVQSCGRTTIIETGGSATSFDGNILATVGQVRVWKYLYADPPVRGFQHWQGKDNVFEIEGFDKESGPKAHGRFLEILLWLENHGTKEHVTWVHREDRKGIDVHLECDTKLLEIVGFRFPGANVAPVSLIRRVEGTLGAKLKPQERTWLLLVFDLPARTEVARLRVVNFPPIDMNLGG